MPSRFKLLCHARTDASCIGSPLISCPAILWIGEQCRRYQRRLGLLRPLIRRYPRHHLEYLAHRQHRQIFGWRPGNAGQGGGLSMIRSTEREIRKAQETGYLREKWGTIIAQDPFRPESYEIDRR